MTLNIREIVATIRSVIGGEPQIGLHEPRFAGREWAYVKECLDTGWVSSAGTYVGEFERRIASVCGVRHAVAVVNGTAALHLALVCHDIGAGDEVIVPALSFAATANAVAHAGATPHFADCEAVSLGVDPQKLERHLSEIAVAGEACLRNRITGRRIAAIVPMHTFGHPVDLAPLLSTAARYNLPIIEDAAEALGSLYKGQPAGSLGSVGTLSFNGNKIITTGGGGAVLTNDERLAQRIRHIATTAKRPHRWEFDHDVVGYNYRMPNLNAALGCAQLEGLDGFVAAKRRLAAAYSDAFAGVDGVTVHCEPEYARSNYWLNVLLLDSAEVDARDHVLAATNDAGLMTRPVWKLLHQLPMYSECPRMDLSVAEDLARRIINIPSSAILAQGPGAATRG